MSDYAKHTMITSLLRQRITEGELAPGDLLPSETQICVEYSVSRATARSALTTLVNEGLVTSKVGIGRFVLDRVRQEYRPQLISGLDSEITDVRIIQSPPDIAQRLALVEVSAVVVRELFTSRMMCSVYVPYALAHSSALARPGQVNIMKVMADIGHESVKSTHEVLSRMPTPDETRCYQLGPGSPVIVHTMTGITERDRPVMVIVTVLPGNLYTVVWDQSM